VSPEEPPRLGISIVKRAAMAATAIVLLSAAAVSAAGFLQLDTVINDFEAARQGRPVIEVPELVRADAGDAQTIMLIGSDQRYEDKQLKIPPRSDTIILARLDPDKDAITLMSIPRDFKVTNPPWGGFSDKINAAYANGGANMVVKTVKQLLSTPERPFEINHVIQIGFGGFRRGIDYLGCVYVDIDRRYFNDRGGVGGFATIDVQPGYQKLCGRDALDYVRYRHTDNDVVRGARQQDFLRQLKDQDAVKAKLSADNRKEILKIVARYTDPDKGFLKKKTLIAMIKLSAYVAKKPVQEVQFGDGRLEDEGQIYLTASADAISDTVDNFFNARTTAKPRGELEATAEEKKAARKTRKKPNKESSIPGLEIARKEGEDQAIVASGKLDFPFYFPELRNVGARYASPEPRTYSIRDGTGDLHRAYRMVLKAGVENEYYGVQGTTWRDPPILDGAHDTIERGGRKLLVYYDGRRVRLVAWKTKKAVYYVHNTLLRTITKRKMIGIAASLRRLGSS
jgi:LCP family protein required for cell wall assembly